MTIRIQIVNVQFLQLGTNFQFFVKNKTVKHRCWHGWKKTAFFLEYEEKKTVEPVYFLLLGVTVAIEH
jgi:hypothetical protein